MKTKNKNKNMPGWLVFNDIIHIIPFGNQEKCLYYILQYFFQFIFNVNLNPMTYM